MLLQSLSYQEAEGGRGARGGWGGGRNLCSGVRWPCRPDGSAEEGAGWGAAGRWAGRRARWRGWSAGQGW